MQIQGIVFLISGGSSGLGAATARMVVEHGGRVVLADTNAVAGEQLAAELGKPVCFVETDVVDEASVQHAVAQTV